jgi:RsiW-degrading membrane proteinase PrsW (M82 family)
LRPYGQVPQPGYQGYPGYPVYPPPYPYGAYPGYNGYAYPPYGWQPVQQPKDGYRLTVVIISLVGSGLAILGGLASIGLAALVYIGASINPNVRGISPDQLFSSILTFTAFAIAGLVGGSFSLYHSIRGLLKKSSASFVLPWFWIFLVLYLLVLGIGYALQVNGQAVTMPALTIFLIILAALFPALTLLSIGVRRLRLPEWATTWRRFTLALTSGATLGIGLALLLELALLFLIVRGPNAANFSQCFDNPNAPGCSSFTTFNLIFIVVAIGGPIIEETVKPLGVALFIGRMRSAAEAFVLGLGAGVGFALVETMGYIGSGYQDWLTVALERTGASLLHGFGTAMVALGWYYFTHAKKQRFLKGIGLWVYAVLQHMIWNGTAVIALIPGPVGTTINNWNLNLGFTSLAFTEVLNIIEALLILVFFIYVTGRLRKQGSVPPTNGGERKGEVRQVAQAVAGR